jgi:hypothetical protein
MFANCNILLYNCTFFGATSVFLHSFTLQNLMDLLKYNDIRTSTSWMFIEVIQYVVKIITKSYDKSNVCKTIVC